VSGKRRGISSWSIRRPIGTVMIASVAVVLGLFFLGQLPIDLLPNIVYPQIRASVNNPGVAPEVMEETIAKPLEGALAPTEDLENIETEIQEGRVGVNLDFSYGTDMDFALQDASKNLERARGNLPEEADPPTIYKFDPAQIPIYEVGFSSSQRDLVSLRDWVDTQLRPRLLTVQGVASVDVAGGLEREIQVVLDQERLRSYGLTISGVIDVLRSGNQDVAAGVISSEEREVVGKTSATFARSASCRWSSPAGGGSRWWRWRTSATRTPISGSGHASTEPRRSSSRSASSRTRTPFRWPKRSTSGSVSSTPPASFPGTWSSR
jgi:multidrug efflux pump subunit AcrB